VKILFIISWVGIMMLNSTTSRAAEVSINVTNIDVKRGGSIIVMIFGENGFPIQHEKAFFILTDNSLQESMKFTFNLNMEEMAVKVLHDENEDGKVTKNWMGIYPREGLGFSNDQAISVTGAPGYKKSKLSRDQFKDGLNISIKYP